jgi:hypothetical protein
VHYDGVFQALFLFLVFGGATTVLIVGTAVKAIKKGKGFTPCQNALI